MASNTAFNANAGGGNSLGPTVPVTPRGIQNMRNFIRNLNELSTQVPPLYSSYEKFEEYHNKLRHMKAQIRYLTLMVAAIKSMCPGMELDCLKELQEITEENDAFLKEVIRQANIVPLATRREAMSNANAYP